MSEFLEDLHPDTEEHETGDDGNEAEGGPHEEFLVDDEVENKSNPTEGDENGTEKVKHKPGKNLNTFLPSDTENHHQAGTDTKQGDQDHDDEHGIRVVKVDDESVILNDSTIHQKKADTKRHAQQ